LIFAVGSNDTTTIDESRKEFHKLLEEDEFREAVLHLYAKNKIL
jgi:hypothetical protein